MFRPFCRPDITPGTIGTYRNAIKWLSGSLGRPAVLSDLNPLYLKELFLALAQENVARITIVGIRKRLLTLWKHAATLGWAVKFDPPPMPTSAPSLSRRHWADVAAAGTLLAFYRFTFRPALVESGASQQMLTRYDTAINKFHDFAGQTMAIVVVTDAMLTEFGLWLVKGGMRGRYADGHFIALRRILRANDPERSPAKGGPLPKRSIAKEASSVRQPGSRKWPEPIGEPGTLLNFYQSIYKPQALSQASVGHLGNHATLFRHLRKCFGRELLLAELSAALLAQFAAWLQAHGLAQVAARHSAAGWRLVALKQQQPAGESAPAFFSHPLIHFGELNMIAKNDGISICEVEEARANIKYIDVNKIEPHPDNPRSTIDQEELEALGASIANLEQLQPIHVQPFGKGRYRLLTGERRWRAAKLIGRKTIPAFVREVEPHQAAQILAEDNLQHVALNPIDKARAYALLTKPKDKGGAGLTQTALAKRLKQNQSNFANTLKLLKLPAEWQQRVAQGEIGYRQARSLASYVDRPEILAAVAQGREQEPGAWASADAFDAKLATLAAARAFTDAYPTPPPEPAELAEAGVSDVANDDAAGIPTLAVLPLSRRSAPVNHAPPNGEAVLSELRTLIGELKDVAQLDRVYDFVALRRDELTKSNGHATKRKVK